MRSNSRTHEENQERAYIAASRRSDRSVEARVESARRASEIHKRRTGKALKVTEQDVLADEMYEEEDDELPAPYRNLNAHLHTGSSDFDARLQAYLANAVAFRKALSGVSRPGDKSKQADFVNKRQLADHTSLFPKHSEAWKDIVIPKCSSSTSSPFLPQGTTFEDSKKFNPYNTKFSSLSSRRMSANQAESVQFRNSNKTQELKGARPPRSTAKSTKTRASQFVDQLDSPDQSHRGINYDAIDNSRHNSSDSAMSDNPFTARLPNNALQMLLPYQVEHENTNDLSKQNHETCFSDAGLNQRHEDSIDATLVAPRQEYLRSTVSPGDTGVMDQAVVSTTWNPLLWDETAQHDISVSSKSQDNEMWGSFIDEGNATSWDWHTDAAVV